MRHPTAGKFWTAFAALLTTAFAAAPNAKTAPVAPAARPAGAVVLKLGHAGSVSAVAFTPDGTLVCVAGMRPEVLHWNPHKRTLSHLDASPPSTRGSVLSPQERWLIAGDDAPSDRGSVVLCDSRTGAEVARMEGPPVARRSLTFSANEEWLAAVGSVPGAAGSSEIVVWNARFHSPDRVRAALRGEP